MPRGGKGITVEERKNAMPINIPQCRRGGAPTPQKKGGKKTLMHLGEGKGPSNWRGLDPHSRKVSYKWEIKEKKRKGFRCRHHPSSGGEGGWKKRGGATFPKRQVFLKKPHSGKRLKFRIGGEDPPSKKSHAQGFGPQKGENSFNTTEKGVRECYGEKKGGPSPRWKKRPNTVGQKGIKILNLLGRMTLGGGKKGRSFYEKTQKPLRKKSPTPFCRKRKKKKRFISRKRGGPNKKEACFGRAKRSSFEKKGGVVFIFDQGKEAKITLRQRERERNDTKTGGKETILCPLEKKRRGAIYFEKGEKNGLASQVGGGGRGDVTRE